MEVFIKLKKILSLVLLITWMITIFVFSHQQGTGSSRTSEKVSEFIVNVCDIREQLSNEEKNELIGIINPIIRKVAHLTIYTIGGFLLINLIHIQKDRKEIFYSGIVGVLYAITDEIHQLFIEGRSGRIEDIIIDSIGIFLGIYIFLFIKEIVRRNKEIVKNKKGEKKLNIGQSDLSVIGNTMVNTELNIDKSIQKATNKKIAYKKTKRIMDVILSAVGMIVLSPIFFIIAIAIKLDSKGSVFFLHNRIGKNGKIIKIYKFRTMVPNAEDLIEKFDEEQIKEFKENYKLKEDPRVTKVGKFLRKTSLDELPQILNILKGDLSIIGPRPVIEEELEKWGDNKSKLLSVTPGLTGYWAANGRSDITYDERISMELFYIDNCSLLLDIKIFFKTIISVIKKEGAR